MPERSSSKPAAQAFTLAVTINHEGFRTVRENVIIAYRGTNYELGQWPQGYGIWTAGASHSQPNEWWPGTPEGWSAAWYRFVAIEVPGTIVQVSPPTAVPAGQPAAQAGQLAAQAGQPNSQAGQAGVADAAPQAGVADAAPQAGVADPAPPSLQPFVLPAGQPHMAAGGQPHTAPAGRAYTAPAGQPYTAQAGQPHTAQAGQPYAGPPYAAQGQGYGASGFSAQAWGQPYGAAQGQYANQRPGARATWLNPLAVGLLIFGLVCGVISLFPTYVGGSSLASEPVNLVPHVIYLAGWAAAVVLIGMGGARQRVGSLLGLGVSVVTFGLFFADAGLPLAHGAHAAGMGVGLVLGILGWVGCAAGSCLAFGRWPADWPRPLRVGEIGFAATLIAAAIGAAITFAPSWDRYVLATPTASQTITEGNAFSNPGPVIVGDVAVMIAIVAVLVAAALWRPARLGWALAAGAILPLIAQLISALIQITESGLTQLGITPAQASAASLKVTPSLTAWFWAYCAFVIVLILLCGWLAARPDRPVAVATQGGAPLYTGPAAGWPGTPGTPGAAGPGTPGAAGPGVTGAAGPGVTGAAGPGVTAPAGPAGESPAEGQAAGGSPAADSSAAYTVQPQDGLADSGS
jgi:hypothetical protein